MLEPYVSTVLFVLVWLLAPWSHIVMAGKPRFVQHPADKWALQGERLTLECQAEGVPTPTVTWWHDNRPLLDEKKEGAARWELRGTRLLFRRLVLQHAGYYWCSAFNSDGEVQSRHANLKIDVPAVIVTGPSNRTVEWGTIIHLDCKAIGMPAPRIAWFMNNNVLIDEATGQANVRPTLVVNATRSANYTCQATNTVVKHGDVPTNMTGYVTVVEPKQSVSGVCKPYSGSLCYPAMAAYPQVFYNESLGNGEDGVEAALRDAWQEQEGDVTLTPACLDLALRVLCHLALPQCDTGASTRPLVLPLCREHCEVLREVTCVRRVWRGEASKQLTRADLSRVVPLPHCASLPSLLHQPTTAASPAVCTAPLNLFSPSVFDHSSKTCYSDDGQTYSGEAAHTSAGVACLSWPQSVVVVFAELHNASNHCRNPGGWRDRPWCFVSNNGSWDYCDVEVCGGGGGGGGMLGGTDAPYPMHLAPEGLTGQQALLLGGASLLLVCMASLLACVAYHCVMRQRYHRLRRSGGRPTDLTGDVELTLIARLPRSSRRLAALRRNGGSDVVVAVTGSNGSSVLDNGDMQLLGAGDLAVPATVRTLNLDPSLRPLECARNRVRLLRELGQGAFGKVYLASVVGLQVGGEEDTRVAVKTLRADAAEQLVRDFETEASFVAQLDHANIIRLMGVCTTSEPLCLMYEYMNAGDLHDFLARSTSSHFIARQRPSLASSRRHYQQSTSSDSEDSGRHPRITTAQQLSIGVQVARAMRYFASRNYVHRDLASRNCLVHIRLTALATSTSAPVDSANEMLIVKLADFGLARPIDVVTGMYEGRDFEAVPVRWLPFESSVFNVFSTASDVWSFGVLLWEVFSFAQLPYADLSHDEVLRHLGNGNHLSMPDNTPTEAYDVMVRCWQTVPEHRPTFDTLCVLLDDLHVREQRTGSTS